jgi:hypothetical protein
MSYNLRIPTRRIETIFGSAYPTLSLSYDHKCRFLSHILAGKTGRTANQDRYSSSDIRVGTTEKHKYYDIDINVAANAGYNVAGDIEKWAATNKKLGRLNLAKICNRILRSNTPIDSYMIPSDKSFMVLTWLTANCTINDYQLYSKFGTDISVGFRNPEHSTLFKLTFAGTV